MVVAESVGLVLGLVAAYVVATRGIAIRIPQAVVLGPGGGSSGGQDVDVELFGIIKIHVHSDSQARAIKYAVSVVLLGVTFLIVSVGLRVLGVNL